MSRAPSKSSFLRYHYFTILLCSSFFFNATATTEIYTLSLHDALPISEGGRRADAAAIRSRQRGARNGRVRTSRCPGRSEEHTSELQSRPHLVCRLLLEKKKKQKYTL